MVVINYYIRTSLLIMFIVREFRCAAGIKEVTDVCLSGLIALLSNADG